MANLNFLFVFKSIEYRKKQCISSDSKIQGAQEKKIHYSEPAI